MNCDVQDMTSRTVLLQSVKIASILLFLVLLVLACSYPDPRFIPTFEPNHRYEEYDSFDALRSRVDFEFKIPENIFDYDNVRYLYIPEMRAAEVVYTNDKDWVSFIKMDGFTLDTMSEYDGGFLSFLRRTEGQHEEYAVRLYQPSSANIIDNAMYITNAKDYGIDSSILQIRCFSFRESERLPDQELMFNALEWNSMYEDSYIFSTNYRSLEEMLDWFLYMEGNKEPNK